MRIAEEIGQRQLFFATSDNYNLPVVKGSYSVTFSLVWVYPLPLRRSAVLGASAPRTERSRRGNGGRFLSSFAFLGFLHSHAFPVKFQDRRVMHQPVDCRHRCHRIFEDLIPFRENQIAANNHAAPFISLG